MVKALPNVGGGSALGRVGKPIFLKFQRSLEPRVPNAEACESGKHGLVLPQLHPRTDVLEPHGGPSTTQNGEREKDLRVHVVVVFSVGGGRGDSGEGGDRRRAVLKKEATRR